MKLGIVIVNYKTPELTIECLQSLVVEHEFLDFKVIVVDNDSQDGSFDAIQSAIEQRNWSGWVNVIASSVNGGFSYGNNIAIRHYFSSNNPPEFICLLNPDTYIREGAMGKLTQFMRNNPSVGICGSRIENSDGSVQLSSFKFHSWLTELDRGFSFGVLTRLLAPWITSEQISDNAVKTDWVSGACMMIRSEVFNQIGLFDEAYFMYYEETDFCLHANRAGWECWYVPESRIVHYVGQSSGITGKVTMKRMPNYWFDSRRRYFLKNYGIFHAVLADLFWLIGFFTWRVRNSVQRKVHNYPPRLLRDTFQNSFFCRGFGVKGTRNK